MHPYRYVLVCLLLLGSGCASRQGAEPVTSTHAAAGSVTMRFSGFYEAGWEREVFRPCGSGESWWSWSTERIIQADSRGWGRVFVVLEGAVSPRGSYGHLGQYPREIVVSRVLEVRPEAEAECPASEV